MWLALPTCLVATLGGDTRRLAPVLAALPERTGSEGVLRAVARAGLLRADLDADLLADRFAVFHGLVEACYGFEVSEPYPGRVMHLIASESPMDFMRWGGVATDLSEHVVPGDHHSIWTGAALRCLARHTRAALASPPGT